MKKHLIIAGIICAASIPPAYAVTKCVNLSADTKCTTSSDVSYDADWTATCNGVQIQGVVYPGVVKSGATAGSVADNTGPASESSAATCYCKIISPVVSRWVIGHPNTNSDECAGWCGRIIMDTGGNGNAFRTAIFSNLSD